MESVLSVGELAEFPHCDSMVLHAPGKCFICDQFPDLQKARLDKHINFTGETFAQDRDGSPILGDPATAARSLDSINHWGGNRAYTKKEWDKMWVNDWDEKLTPSAD